MSTAPWRGRGNDATTGEASDGDRLRADIDATHRRLEGLLGELDRRRREAFDVRLQARRHPLFFAAGAALALGAVGGGTALAIARIHRRRRGRSPAARLFRLWQISGRSDASANGSRGTLRRLAGRAAKVAVAMLVRRLAIRTFMRRRARE